jgi:hypothetical protein
MQVDGKQLIANLRKIGRNAPGEFERAQYEETEVEAAECKRVTPVDTGSLRNSVHAEGPTWRGKQCETAVVAGGPAAGYAIYVHEDLSADHPVGQAKYIEGPLLQSAPFMGRRIAKRIDLNRAMR